MKRSQSNELLRSKKCRAGLPLGASRESLVFSDLGRAGLTFGKKMIGTKNGSRKLTSGEGELIALRAK